MEKIKELAFLISLLLSGGKCLSVSSRTGTWSEFSVLM